MFAKRVLDSSYMASKTLFLNLMTLARTRGCFLLSTNSPTGAGAGSAPTPSGRSCATSTTTTRTCGPGCWHSRPSLGKQPKSSTGPRNFPTSTPCSGRRTSRPRRQRHSQELLVLLGFHSAFLSGIVIAFPDKSWYRCCWRCREIMLSGSNKKQN